MFLNDKPYCNIGNSKLRSFINLFLSLVLEKVCKLVMTFLEDIFSRHAVLHKCVTINKSGWKYRHSQTDAVAYLWEEMFLFLEIELKFRDCKIGRNFHPNLLEGFPSSAWLYSKCDCRVFCSYCIQCLLTVNKKICYHICCTICVSLAWTKNSAITFTLHTVPPKCEQKDLLSHLLCILCLPSVNKKLCIHIYSTYSAFLVWTKNSVFTFAVHYVSP